MLVSVNFQSGSSEFDPSADLSAHLSADRLKPSPKLQTELWYWENYQPSPNLSSVL